MQGKPVFAPMLAIPHGTTSIDFYLNAFGAIELRRFSNDNGTIHVSELSISGTLFHLHEDMERVNVLSPATVKATTISIGLFVENVQAVVDAAVAAGATILTPVKDYDYGYRQAEIRDPFGHCWQIQKAI
ncbi:VOC family protein [Mucilaginibacter sp.]|uniref:VOC family protein n=1 Tax=Mucilaginibacter sp. TaxID=1882438 RepID=UPI0035BC089D